MIDRREILDIAYTLGLLPHVVEKDYVLGWVLAGIYQHAAKKVTDLIAHIETFTGQYTSTSRPIVWSATANRSSQGLPNFLN